MIKHSEIEEIKKMIKNGFDIELISFELDIPIEEIRQYKLEIETNNKINSVKTYSAREIIDKKNKEAHLKMQRMRERYKKLFLGSNIVEVKLPKEQSKQEIDTINSKITKIEKIIIKMKTISKKEQRRKEAKNILAELKTIEDCQLTIEQSEKLYSLMQEEELKNLSLKIGDKIDLYIDQGKRKIMKKLIEAVDIAQLQIQDLENLNKLAKKITTEMAQSNPISASAVKNRIGNKISKINQQKAIDRIRNNVPADIEIIITEIANGTLDIKKANEIIDKEAKKRVEGKPQNRFTLTEEQEKRQILIQIKTCLMEKPEQYHIKNPEITITQIQKLCGGESEQAIRTVVHNLIGVKKFDQAKKVCDSFYNKYKDEQISKYIKVLRNEIRNAEISDSVLKGINMNGTEYEERAYLELIEKGLKIGNVKLSAISLGKSQDGLRNIYLSDIWEDEEKIQY